jgi:LmbE family N-acetylglucosaminyl deacetylase
MASPKYNLICVAHPDDESLFFAGLIQKWRKNPWRIICMTDAAADGFSRKRKKQFYAACEKLGAKTVNWWAYPDRFDRRLKAGEIAKRLRELQSPDLVFTHGITGEYGHPHHQDVSYAVHQAFSHSHTVYSTAYNVFPDLRIELSSEHFQKKADLLINNYGSETRRFLHLLPITSTEHFVKVGLSDVESIYSYFIGQKKILPKKLGPYTGLWQHIKNLKNLKRPF